MLLSLCLSFSLLPMTYGTFHMDSSAENDESTPKISTYHNPRGVVVVVSHEARDLGIPVIA
jgi:hypothetical protein